MTIQACFAATLVDEWERCGITDAVICPGSRSTPIALALCRSSIRIHVKIDERSAAFYAIGISKATQRVVVVVVTSGTAAAELHPAVVESDLGGVAILVVTADRPAEMHWVGSPQTFEQDGIYGSSVRWAFNPGVARVEASHAWRSMACRAFLEAKFGPRGPGPVHLNLPFTEPLLGDPNEPCILPEGRTERLAWHVWAAGARPPSLDLVKFIASKADSEGLILAGYQPGVEQDSYARGLVGLAECLGWPLLGDSQSGVRSIASANLIASADCLLRSEAFCAAVGPDVVLRFGRPWASKVLSQWLARIDAHQILVDPFWAWSDPERRSSLMVSCDPSALCESVIAQLELARSGKSLRSDGRWAGFWREAEASAQNAMDELFALDKHLTEPWIARHLVSSMHREDCLWVSSSMAVREVEWFSVPGANHPVVLSNRGVNGIDGVVSAASGAANSDKFNLVVLLVGDIAFLHDGSALGGLPDGTRIVVVVVDNCGGEIFSMLPQASMLDDGEFDELFRTPQKCDLAEVARSQGAKVVHADNRESFIAAFDDASKTVDVSDPACAQVIVCRVEPRSTGAVHQSIEREVASRIKALSTKQAIENKSGNDGD